MLEIIDSAEPVIVKSWLHYYKELPGPGYRHQHLFSATGVDLAISQKDTADYTAMVSAHVYRIEKQLQIYIMPHPFNERIPFPQQLEQTKARSLSVGNGSRSRLYIEDVAYQTSIIQQLKSESWPADGFHPQGSDKRQRLSLTAPQIQSGVVMFPETGCENLIKQLLGFPTTKHDDLADAFAILILKILEDVDNDGPSVRIVHTDFWDRMADRAGRGSPADWTRYRSEKPRSRRSIATMSDDEFFSRSSGITIR